MGLTEGSSFRSPTASKDHKLFSPTNYQRSKEGSNDDDERQAPGRASCRGALHRTLTADVRVRRRTVSVRAPQVHLHPSPAFPDAGGHSAEPQLQARGSHCDDEVQQAADLSEPRSPLGEEGDKSHPGPLSDNQTHGINHTEHCLAQ